MPGSIVTTNKKVMCLYPKIIENPRYKPNKKNGGNPPIPNDERLRAVAVGCGKCIECKKQKAREWQARLCEEIKVDKRGKFMTMTFSDEAFEKLDPNNEMEANEFAAMAVELFRKRWYRKYKEGIKHWLITELGHGKHSEGQRSTERLHLHGFIWTDKTDQEIEERWEYGWVDTGEYVNEESVGYCVKYVSKADPVHKEFNGRIFASKGLGKSFMDRGDKSINKFDGENTKEYYRTPSGIKIALPMYYRNKIWTEEEREQLWLQKLDAGDRYVRGEKINTNTIEGEREYINAVKYRQTENEALGYSGEPWNKKSYKKVREKFGM